MRAPKKFAACYRSYQYTTHNLKPPRPTRRFDKLSVTQKNRACIECAFC
jgi:hypothetical protein